MTLQALIEFRQASDRAESRRNTKSGPLRKAFRKFGSKIGFKTIDDEANYKPAAWAIHNLFGKKPYRHLAFYLLYFNRYNPYSYVQGKKAQCSPE